MDLTKHTVLVTGANGFVGRNLIELMRARRINPLAPTRADFDLREQTQVRRMLERNSNPRSFFIWPGWWAALVRTASVRLISITRISSWAQ